MDSRIEKLVEKDPCSGKIHDFPREQDYGVGTIVHCGKCKIRARLEWDQREGDYWMILSSQRAGIAKS